MNAYANPFAGKPDYLLREEINGLKYRNSQIENELQRRRDARDEDEDLHKFYRETSRGYELSVSDPKDDSVRTLEDAMVAWVISRVAEEMRTSEKHKVEFVLEADLRMVLRDAAKYGVDLFSAVKP